MVKNKAKTNGYFRIAWQWLIAVPADGTSKIGFSIPGLYWVQPEETLQGLGGGQYLPQRQHTGGVDHHCRKYRWEVQVTGLYEPSGEGAEGMAGEVEGLSSVDGGIKMRTEGRKVGRTWGAFYDSISHVITLWVLCLQIERDNDLVYERGESVRHWHCRIANVDCLLDTVYD